MKIDCWRKDCAEKHWEDFHRCKYCEKTCKNEDELEEHSRTRKSLAWTISLCETRGISFSGKVELLNLVSIVPLAPKMTLNQVKYDDNEIDANYE